MLLHTILGSLTLLSVALLLWQWFVAQRFPLHWREDAPTFAPPVTLLKPLKGRDPTTEACLRSWFTQDYRGPVQLLFGVASADDPVCAVVRKLISEFPGCDAQLIICGPLSGANLKVSKLIELERLAKHDLLVISDADVRVPRDFLINVVAPLERSEVGLVNCFYRLANATTLAMQWEAIAINADFWSQVLQAHSLKPIEFALGAVMATRRELVKDIGGFEALKDCLADDYLLGNRIARRGHRIALSPVTVECWSEPMGWAAVWRHQLRWARTIRVCQPMPYFFSILSNATLWPLLWLASNPSGRVLGLVLVCGLVRVKVTQHLEKRLTLAPAKGVPQPGDAQTQAVPSEAWLVYAWLAPFKDLLQAGVWLMAFLGNRIEWRGQQMRIRRDGTLVKP